MGTAIANAFSAVPDNSLNVFPAPRSTRRGLARDSAAYETFNPADGTNPLQPWLIAIGAVLIARWPIGARVEMSTELTGKSSDEQFANPA